ncbi:MAG TPA: FAD-dependent oxidoreductase [Candidatus Polarisedimenticolia bacterium]|nr:FAD-dependent oxidoreductase [Candidatus Polarisedimenticolia bacterium]
MKPKGRRKPATPDSRPLTRRLFLNGGLKATLAAGLGARLSIRDLLGQTPGAGGAKGPVTPTRAAARGYEGELIAESYDIAHRLRDGTLEIPALLPEGPLHDAIVVGGGVSGLMAAWDLERGGLSDVVLYEKEDYIGGNARKGNANGTDYTCATWSVVHPKDAFMTRLFQDLGVIQGFAADGTPKIDPALIGPGPDSNTLVDGTWYPDALLGGGQKETAARLPLSAKDRRDYVAFYDELSAWATKKGKDGRPAFAMPVEEGSRDPDILALDRITMEEYARRKGWGPRTLVMVDEWSTSDIGGSMGEVSAYGFLAFNSLGQGGEDITLPGGNAWLAARLSEKVGRDRLRTDLMVVRVENHDDEARVTLLDPRSGRFSMRRARSAVLACPKHITGRMVPELLASGRDGFRRYRYGALLMGAASVKRTPALKGAPIAWYNSSQGRLSQGFLVADYNSDRWRHGDARRPNVLCLWAPLEGKVPRVDLLTEPWSHWADRLADDLEFMVPGILDDVTRLDVYVWGHHMVIPTPGFLTGDERRALTRPLGRITFAHSDRNGMPSFELATRAGSDAAREAVALVRGAPA